MLLQTCFILAFAAFGAQSFALSKVSNVTDDDKIVGGSVANIKSYPWRVLFLNDKGRTMGLCAGTILSPEWIMTAAHCFGGYNANSDTLKVYSGNSDFRRGTESLVKRFIIHEQYRMGETTSPYDIALLQLQTRLTLSPQGNKVAACLTTFSNDGDIAGGYSVYASGWGKYEDGNYANTLRATTLKVISNDECKRTNNINELQICTHDEPKDVCNGDSGGSIDYIQNGKCYPVGIVSYGPANPCGRGGPGVYTRVSQFKSWIESKTGALRC